jgi:hypothetical protein
MFHDNFIVLIKSMNLPPALECQTLAISIPVLFLRILRCINFDVFELILIVHNFQNIRFGLLIGIIFLLNKMIAINLNYLRLELIKIYLVIIFMKFLLVACKIFQKSVAALNMTLKLN